MTHTIPAKPLAELRALVVAQNAVQQRVIDYARACALMLGLDADDPTMTFDLAKGAFTVPDAPASLAAPLPSDNAPPVPVAEP